MPFLHDSPSRTPPEVDAGWHGGEWYAPRDYGQQARSGEQTWPHVYAPQRTAQEPRYAASAGSRGFPAPQGYDAESSVADRFGGLDAGQTGLYMGASQEAQRAQQAHLQPRPPKGYRRSDEKIYENICDCLIEVWYLDVSDVSVEVKDGMVTLEGTVPDRRMKHTIEDIAAESFGVNDVDNQLRVSQRAA